MRWIRFSIQWAVYLCYLFTYPIHSPKSFHHDVIATSRTRATPRQSAKPNTGLVLFLQFVALIAIAYAQDSSPLVDLSSGHVNYDIKFDHNNFRLIYDTTGVVMYHTALQRRHQMVGISRVLDYTEIGLANFNVKSSLHRFNQPALYDDFHFINKKVYHVSNQNMTYQDCKLFCASKAAMMINTAQDAYRVTRHFEFRNIWLDTTTSVSDKIYSVHMGNTSLFPLNHLTNYEPKIFYQKGLEIIQTDAIETFYTEYYDSIKKEYWPTSYYNLKVGLETNGSLSIFLPIEHRELNAILLQCACTKLPTEAHRVMRQISLDLAKIKIQSSSLNLTVEPSRFRNQNFTESNVFSILNGKFQEQPLHTFAQIEQILPLDYNAKTYDNIITPSSVALFTAKAIGVPLLQKAFESYMKKFGAKIGAKRMLFNNNSMVNQFILPHEVQLSGIQSSRNNLSITLSFDSVSAFEKDLSVLETDHIHVLLRNLSITNEQFLNFINTKIYDYVINFASLGIDYQIDTSLPVLVKLKPASSFIKFDVFFPCFERNTVMTKYTILSLPHKSINGILETIEIPQQVLVNPDSFSFSFEGTYSKTLSDCLDTILSGQIAESCQKKPFLNSAITRSMELEHITLYTLQNKGKSANIKVSCQNQQQFTAGTPHTITVLAVNPACHIAFNTEVGTISLKGNLTYPSSSSFLPRILFGYTIYDQNSQAQNNTILIISVSAAVVLLAIIVTSAILFLYTHSRKVTITEDITPSVSSSEDSQITVRNYVINPLPQSCPNTTCRTVKFSNL